MIIPNKLNKNDKIATVSLSWGGAGDKEINHRYLLGKRRLEEVFNLKVVEMPNSLKGSDYLDKHPEARAEDLMNAFKDTEIKGIFSNIGGDDAIRLLPYIDFDIITNNPKIFIGYSDTTINHFMLYKAGLRSYYGPCVLCEFAENYEMHEYTKKWIKKTLFDNSIIGKVNPSNYWTTEFLDWTNPKNNIIKRKLSFDNKGYEVLQGKGTVSGKLIGGCIEVFDWIRGTSIMPKINDFDNAILFLETSEDKPTPNSLKYLLRSIASIGILKRINGILFAKPYDEKYYEEYKEIILKVIRDEEKCEELPILYNMNFGHTSPMFIIPYGALGKIDCDNKEFNILESGVL